MSITWWNSWLTSPVILGVALFVSDSVICGVASEAAIAHRSPLQETILDVKTEGKHPTGNNLVVSTTPVLATISATTLEEPSVADIEEMIPIIMSEDKSVVVDIEVPKTTDVVKPEQQLKSLITTPPKMVVESSPTSVLLPKDADVLEQIESYTNETNENNPDSLDQVTNVSQLRDVSPGDWAFEALRSLVERYGCIAGYPDGTYRGNRSLTRYEFAAGLNACLQQIERLISSSGEESVRREDLVTLQRIIGEFAPELAALRGRVDGIEERTNELELTQFSTTTKLDGEAIFGVAGIASGDDIFGESADNVWIFGSRARLNLETSFTGRDLLRTRLQAVGLETFTPRTQTFEGNLAFAGEDANNNVEIDALLYSFPISSSTQVVLMANGGAADDFASTVNFLDGDGGFGALTRFGTRNPIYYLVEGSGIGIRQQLGKTFELSLGYLAGDAGNPASGGGLFNGPYGAMAQLVYKPSDRFQIGLTYINSYNRETLTGSPLSNPQSLIRTLAGQPISTGDVPQPAPGIVPTTFFAGQQVPTGSTIPANTTLPPGTQLTASLALPFPLPDGLPFPITVGFITFPPGTPIPAGVPIPAGTSLPNATPIPQDFVLPVPISLTTPGTSLTALVPGTPLPPDNFTGTLGDLLQRPDFAGFPLGFDLNIPIISNSYGLQFSWQASDRFVLGGWVGYTNTSTLSTGNGLLSRGSIDTINGAITLAFPDLGKQGNLAGIIVGVEPTVLNSDIEVNQNLVNPASINNPALIPAGLALLNSSPRLRQLINTFDNPDPDVSLHVEAFYQMKVTDNIFITPGIIWITAPGSLAGNADLVIGTLRTTFRF
ncbi:iron uptake porin [Allocoleopsis franciscana]|uniref:Putative S-layer protein n=1 Tax=Allocoleopsis franciscana PCC 7113 TaxID=1173027 RepID=K9WA41_9CYAN|nr:iron uptake porin [Allocoleopsis franciscana]AFZ17260.1 putative S-layer protein [Allocoleopsis franciscana PCC 7113]